MRRLLLLLLLTLIALAIQAPAWLLAASVAERTAGVVELRNASGTLWNGAADAVARGRSAGQRDQPLGRIAWRVERLDWAQRTLQVAIAQTPAAPQPATLTIGFERSRLAGALRVPAAAAAGLPLVAGWVLGGDVVFSSEGVDVTGGAATGTVAAFWHDAAVLPPDLPGGLALGEVTARVTLQGGTVGVSVRNGGGDVDLTGEASSRTRAVMLALQPRPAATPAQLAWLQSHTMGRTPRGFTIETAWPAR